MKKYLTLILFNLIIVPSVAFSLSWEMNTLDDQKKSIEDYHGKWVIVNFWATWCPPCREEIPELSSFHENNKGKAVVLGMNYEEVNSDKLNRFIDDYFMEYPQFKMSPYLKAPIGSIPGLPTTFLISPKGEVVAKQVGQINEEMLTTFINNWDKK